MSKTVILARVCASNRLRELREGRVQSAEGGAHIESRIILANTSTDLVLGPRFPRTVLAECCVTSAGKEHVLCK